MKKTIKIIDLLVRCNLGDLTLPEKIKKGDKVYKKESSTVGHYYYIEDNGNTLLDDTNNFVELNYELEIIEEDKKIEKLDVALLGQCDNWLRCPTNKVTKQDIELNPYIIDTIRENTLGFQHKINEIIDAINELKKGE